MNGLYEALGRARRVMETMLATITEQEKTIAHLEAEIAAARREGAEKALRWASINDRGYLYPDETEADRESQAAYIARGLAALGYGETP